MKNSFFRSCVICGLIFWFGHWFFSMFHLCSVLARCFPHSASGTRFSSPFRFGSQCRPRHGFLSPLAVFISGADLSPSRSPESRPFFDLDSHRPCLFSPAGAGRRSIPVWLELHRAESNRFVEQPDSTLCLAPQFLGGSFSLYARDSTAASL
jgi:hypothetical protein